MVTFYKSVSKQMRQELKFWRRGNRQYLLEGGKDHAIGVVFGLKLAISIVESTAKQHKTWVKR